jgi:hypothetical protein
MLFHCCNENKHFKYHNCMSFYLGENRLDDRAVLEGDGFRLDDFLGRMLLRLRSRLGTFVNEPKWAAVAFSDLRYFVKL